MQTYAERNAGQPMQRYLITKPGAKHGRPEVIDGRETYVVYSGPDRGLAETGMECPNEILLTAKDAEKLRHLKLIALTGTRQNAGEIVTLPNMEVSIPADWVDLPVDTRKTLAGKIKGEEVSRVKEADNIIREYLNGRQA